MVPIRKASWTVTLVALASSGCGASSAPATSTPALVVKLPQAEEWSQVTPSVWIDVLANGDMAVDGQKARGDVDFIGLVHRASAKDPGPATVVRADTSVPYGREMHVLDLLKQTGVQRIAFGVTPVGKGALPEPGSPPGEARAMLRAGQPWNCPYPEAADAERIDSGTAVLTVTADATGKPRWVRILRDSGYGFGQAAAACALNRQYVAAPGQEGMPIQTMSLTVRIHFQRGPSSDAE